MAMQQAMKQIPLSRMSGFDVCVLTIEVEEGHTHGQEHDDGDDGDDDGDNGAGDRLLPLPSPQAARPPLSVPSTAWAFTAGWVLQVALCCIFYNQGVPVNIVWWSGQDFKCMVSSLNLCHCR